jgi:hypothetical protein
MCTNPHDQYQLAFVVYFRIESILIAPKVEDHAIPPEEARLRIYRLEVVGALPLGILDFRQPRRCCGSQIPVTSEEIVQSLSTDDSHLRSKVVRVFPSWE